MGVVRPGSPVHAWHCQPKAVCMGEVPRQRPRPSSNVRFSSLGLNAPGKEARCRHGVGGGVGGGRQQKRLKVFSQPSLSSQAPPCWLPPCWPLPSLAMREALGGGQGEGEVLVDRGPL